MFALLCRLWNQTYFISTPTLTEKNLPDQIGRVFIVTGGYTGCGRELAKILYQHNGTVYLAGRSKDKGDAALKELKAAYPDSKGRVEFLQLDLADLSTIKASAEDFLKRETRLDVLTNNAGVMFPPAGSSSAQGYELQMATNCLGPYLFTKLLTPLIEKTANLSDTPNGSVRVTWAASFGADMLSPPGGVSLDADGNCIPDPKNNQQTNYGATKAGNVFLATEFARRYPLNGSTGKGIVSNAWNPGNLRTELARHTPSIQVQIGQILLHPAIYGGYTELFAGWSDDAGKAEKNGAYIIPWGRFGILRDDVTKEWQAGGKAEKFWEWCEKETKEYC